MFAAMLLVCALIAEPCTSGAVGPHGGEPACSSGGAVPTPCDEPSEPKGFEVPPAKGREPKQEREEVVTDSKTYVGWTTREKTLGPPNYFFTLKLAPDELRSSELRTYPLFFQSKEALQKVEQAFSKGNAGTPKRPAAIEAFVIYGGKGEEILLLCDLVYGRPEKPAKK